MKPSRLEGAMVWAIGLLVILALADTFIRGW